MAVQLLSTEAESFIVSRRAKRLSPRTIDLYEHELALFLAWAAPDATAVADLSPALLRRWLIYLAETRNAGGIHANYRILKTWMRWLWRDADLDGEPPIAKVDPPRLTDPPPSPAALDHVRAALRTCGRDFIGLRDRALIMALLDSGARANEMLSLDLDDADLTQGTVIIRHGKGGKPRLTFFGANTLQAIRRYMRARDAIANGPHLWCTETGDRMTYWALRQMLERRSIAANVPTLRAHALRRLFATLMTENGCNPVILQKMMGHSDLGTTVRYIRVSAAQQQKTHREHSPGDVSL
jgi:site-specific recombinase XerD